MPLTYGWLMVELPPWWMIYRGEMDGAYPTTLLDQARAEVTRTGGTLVGPPSFTPDGPMGPYLTWGMVHDE